MSLVTNCQCSDSPEHIRSESNKGEKKLLLEICWPSFVTEKMDLNPLIVEGRACVCFVAVVVWLGFFKDFLILFPNRYMECAEIRFYSET